MEPKQIKETVVADIMAYALPTLRTKLPTSLEEHWTNFARKYLNACIRVLLIQEQGDEAKVKILFYDKKLVRWCYGGIDNARGKERLYGGITRLIVVATREKFWGEKKKKKANGKGQKDNGSKQSKNKGSRNPEADSRIPAA